jgi:hypothetical protein
MFFPKWSDLNNIWKAWKKALWSNKPGDKTKAWTGIAALVALLGVVLTGFSVYHIIFTIILVDATIQLTLNSVEKSE